MEPSSFRMTMAVPVFSKRLLQTTDHLDDPAMAPGITLQEPTDPFKRAISLLVLPYLVSPAAETSD